MTEKNQPVQHNEPAPILGTWNRMYVFVLALHALLIAFFYWLTKIFS